jgi:dihydroflavonol-4-reductase
MKGCDRVMHLAAIYALWMDDPGQLWDVNVRGTQVVCQAALDAGVERMVYTSSIAALGILPGEQPADETTQYNYWGANDYIFSKYVSELECREYIRRGLPAVIVNPALPFGWGDTGPTPTGNIVLSLMNGKFPGYIEGGVNVVDVRDVARGHLLAEEKGRIGERYILGGHNVTTFEFMSLVGRVCGVKVPKRRLPAGMLMKVGKLLEGVADRVTHTEPFITEKGVDYARRHVYFDTTKARQELGLPLTAIEESIAESARWFRSRGLAK